MVRYEGGGGLFCFLHYLFIYLFIGLFVCVFVCLFVCLFVVVHFTFTRRSEKRDVFNCSVTVFGTMWIVYCYMNCVFKIALS